MRADRDRERYLDMGHLVGAKLAIEAPRNKDALKRMLDRLKKQRGLDPKVAERSLHWMKPLPSSDFGESPAEEAAELEEILMESFGNLVVKRGKRQFHMVIHLLCDRAFWNPHEMKKRANAYLRAYGKAAKQKDLYAVLVAIMRIGIFCGKQLERTEHREQRVRDRATRFLRSRAAKATNEKASDLRKPKQAAAKAAWLRMVRDEGMTRGEADRAIARRHLKADIGDEDSAARTVVNWRSRRNGNWAAEL